MALEDEYELMVQSPQNEDSELLGHGREQIIQSSSSRRRFIIRSLLAFIVAIGAIIGLLISIKVDLASLVSQISRQAQGVMYSNGIWTTTDTLKSGLYVMGPPGVSLDGNLKADIRYVTAFLYAGWTNQFISQCHLILLAMMSRRVPILSPFIAHGGHLGGNESPIDFSVIFDMPRLSHDLQWPILEWSQLKLSVLTSNVTTRHEELNCWALTRSESKSEVYGTEIQRPFNFDITYTTAPDFAFMPNDWWGSFTGLANLLQPEGYEYAMSHSDKLRSFAPYGDGKPQMVNSTISPDQHMACFNHIYFLGGRTNYEYEHDVNPMWNLVGVNVHFTSHMDELANGYIRRIFDVSINARIPPFISIHIRRADFEGWCEPGRDRDYCLAPISAYARRLGQVQHELAGKHGPQSPLSRVGEVIVTSDEADPNWWAQIARLGWKTVDHEREQTVEKFGHWYPSLIDSIILSKGAGCVGTARSTFSNIAEARVKDWNGGPIRKVRWGSPDADMND
ncbi:hypothetical protein FRB96_001997 [Tulasnella sp. 330]|nr:hypothetical protein FRB96_001997 [Tulasnella sp. 330]